LEINLQYYAILILALRLNFYIKFDCCFIWKILNRFYNSCFFKLSFIWSCFSDEVLLFHQLF